MQKMKVSKGVTQWDYRSKKREGCMPKGDCRPQLSKDTWIQGVDTEEVRIATM